MSIATRRTPGVDHFTDAQLLRTLQLFARDPELSRLIDLAAPTRQRQELERTPFLQIWVMSWPLGARTGWHDHGGSSGAHLTVIGELTERTWPGRLHEQVIPNEGRAFAGSHVHEVVNEGLVPALSLHAYAPALGRMTSYDVRQGRLVEVTDPD